MVGGMVGRPAPTAACESHARLGATTGFRAASGTRRRSGETRDHRAGAARVLPAAGEAQAQPVVVVARAKPGGHRAGAARVLPANGVAHVVQIACALRAAGARVVSAPTAAAPHQVKSTGST